MDTTPGQETARRRARAYRRAFGLVAEERDVIGTLEAILELGSETLETDFATLSRVHRDAGRYVFERVAAPDGADLEAGETTTLEELPNCARVVDAEEMLVLADVPDQAPELADPTWGIECYLGAPVTVDGQVYGTFCFYDTVPREEAFADWEVTFVEHLAEWASRALSTRRELDRLATRAEVDAVARETAAAAIGGATREEIERAVCRSLAAADAFRGAWIGEAEPADDDLAVRAAAGPDAASSDPGLPLADSAAHAAPSARTMETGDVHVSRVDEPSTDAVVDGPGSVISVPVAYQGIIQCVLTIHANDSDAFEGEHRTILAHLGDVLGHAIAAAEREQLVTNDRAIELTLRVRGALDADELDTDGLPHVVVDDIVQVQAGHFTGYATVETADRAALEGLATIHPAVDAVSNIATRPAGFDVELSLSDAPVLSSVFSLGGSVDRIVLDGEDVRLRLLLPTDVDARRVVETAREAYPGTTVSSKREVRRPDATVRSGRLLGDLTERQLAALRAAYFAGYYERPRETEGGEVADTLGISGATFSQHRRAAERKLLRALFEESAAE